MVSIMTIQGSFHIVWSNSEEPTATPKYKVQFPRVSCGGALRPQYIEGESELEAYLVKAGFTHASAGNWATQLHSTGSVDIPHQLDEEEYRASYMPLPTSA
jgi:hypothetical protein